jgi:hypothetical protein
MAKFDETVSGPNLKGLGSATRSDSPGPAIAQGVSDLASAAMQFTQQRRRNRFSTELEEAQAKDQEALAANQAEISALQEGMPTTNEEFLGLGPEGSEAQQAFQAKWDRIRQLEARQPTLANLRQKELIAEFSTRYPLQTQVWQSALQRANGTSDYLSQLQNAAPSREEQYMMQLQKHAADNGWSEYRTAKYLAGEARWKSGDLNKTEQDFRGMITDSHFAQAGIAGRMSKAIEAGELPPEQVVAQSKAELANYHQELIARIQGSQGISETARNELIAQAKLAQQMNEKEFDILANLEGDRRKSLIAHQTEARNTEIGEKMTANGMHRMRDKFDAENEEGKGKMLDAVYQVAMSSAKTFQEFQNFMEKTQQTEFTRQTQDGQPTLINVEDLMQAVRLGMQDVWAEVGSDEKISFDDLRENEGAWQNFRADAIAIMTPALAKSDEPALRRAGSICMLGTAAACDQVATGGNNNDTRKLMYQDIEKLAASPEIGKMVNQDTEVQDQVRAEFNIFAQKAADLARKEGFMLGAASGGNFDSSVVEKGAEGLMSVFQNELAPREGRSGGRIEEIYTVVGPTEYVQFDKDFGAESLAPGRGGAALVVLGVADAIASSLGVQPGFSHRMGAGILDLSADAANLLSAGAGPEARIERPERKHPSPELQAAIKKLNVYGTLGRHFMSTDELHGFFPEYTGKGGDPLDAVQQKAPGAAEGRAALTGETEGQESLEALLEKYDDN